MGLDSSTVEIIEILLGISEKIADKVMHYFQQNPIEKDKKEFYERTKKYYERTRRLYYKNEGSPERLANDIDKDNLFSFITGHEYAENIIHALYYVSKLPKRKRKDARQILKQLLKIFEKIGGTAFAYNRRSND